MKIETKEKLCDEKLKDGTYRYSKHNYERAFNRLLVSKKSNVEKSKYLLPINHDVIVAKKSMDKISNSEIGLMLLEQGLRKKFVKRWHIVDVEPQTLSDHCYNIAVIADVIVELLLIVGFNKNTSIMEWHNSKNFWRSIDEHDLDEVLLGDVPSNDIEKKEQKVRDMLSTSPPEMIILKMADLMDACLHLLANFKKNKSIYNIMAYHKRLVMSFFDTIFVKTFGLTGREYGSFHNFLIKTIETNV